MAANYRVEQKSRKFSKWLLISTLVLCIVSGAICFVFSSHSFDEKMTFDKSVGSDIADTVKDDMPKFRLPNDWQFSDTKINLKLGLVEIEDVKKFDSAYDVVVKGFAFAKHDSPIRLHLKIDMIVGTEDYYVADVVSIYAADDKTIENTFEGWRRAYLLHLQSTLISRK